MTMRVIAFVVAVAWGSGCIGTGVALDQKWGTLRDDRCDYICDLLLKPIVVMTWPLWMPGYATFRLLSYGEQDCGSNGSEG